MAKTITLDTFRVRSIDFSYRANPGPDGAPVGVMTGVVGYELRDSTADPPVVVARSAPLEAILDGDQRGRILAQMQRVIAALVAREGMAGATVEF